MLEREDSESSVVVVVGRVVDEDVNSGHPACEIGRPGTQTPLVLVVSTDSDELRVELLPKMSEPRLRNRESSTHDRVLVEVESSQPPNSTGKKGLHDWVAEVVEVVLELVVLR